MSDQTVEERIAAAKERRAERDRAAEEAAQLHELEGLELREKYEEELGEMGKAWFLADSSGGWIIVKIGPSLRWKQWQIAVDKANDLKRPIDPSDAVAFVKDCIVYPKEERVKEIYAQYPGLYMSLTGPLTALHTGKTKVQAGKV